MVDVEHEARVKRGSATAKTTGEVVSLHDVEAEPKVDCAWCATANRQLKRLTRRNDWRCGASWQFELLCLLGRSIVDPINKSLKSSAPSTEPIEIRASGERRERFVDVVIGGLSAKRNPNRFDIFKELVV